MSGCKDKEKNVEKPEIFTFTVFSDVHHDYGRNTYEWPCAHSLEKVKKIIEETPDSEFYIQLGDFSDAYRKEWDEAMAFVKENGLVPYDPESTETHEGKRILYNLLGNHEAAYAEKSSYSDYVPYVENVGSVYGFTHKGVLFLAIDALFNYVTKTDDPETIRKTQSTGMAVDSNKFTIADPVIAWAENKARDEINEANGGIKSIVWLSHIAFKDIDKTSAWTLIDKLNAFGLPLTILEGHTHVGLEQHFDDYDGDEWNTKVDIYTLPAVVTGYTYAYYNLTFEGGVLKSVDKFTENVIEY